MQVALYCRDRTSSLAAPGWSSFAEPDDAEPDDGAYALTVSVGSARAGTVSVGDACAGPACALTVAVGGAFMTTLEKL